MASGDLSPMMVYIFMGLMILIGAIGVSANKAETTSVALGKTFSHFWFITYNMFLGEMLCLVVYYFSYRKTEKETPLVDQESSDTVKQQPPEPSPFTLIIPALCDFCGSTIVMLGLTMIAPSVYQMFRGSLIIFTAIFSLVFLKAKLYRHHYFAMMFVLSGLVLVGLSTELYKPVLPDHCGGSSAESNSIWGCLLIVIGQIFSATQFIVEEKLLKGYTCHPLKIVGWEGVWGSSLYTILLLIFQFIPCDGSSKLGQVFCTEDDEGNWRLENTIFALKQIGSDGTLLLYVIFCILLIGSYNFIAVSITKYASSTSRTVIDVTKSVFVWFFWMMPWINECYREHFQYLELLGFILLVLGAALYNEVIILPFFGFDKYTKEALKKKSAGSGINE